MAYDRESNAERVVVVGPDGTAADLDGSGRIALVTPADGADLPNGVTKGLSFAVAGAVSVIDEAGNTVTIPSGALGIGMIHPLRVKRVRATGTTATGIVAYH